MYRYASFCSTHHGTLVRTGQQACMHIYQRMYPDMYTVHTVYTCILTCLWTELPGSQVRRSKRFHKDTVQPRFRAHAQPRHWARRGFRALYRKWGAQWFPVARLLSIHMLVSAMHACTGSCLVTGLVVCVWTPAPACGTRALWTRVHAYMWCT